MAEKDTATQSFVNRHIRAQSQASLVSTEADSSRHTERLYPMS